MEQSEKFKATAAWLAVCFFWGTTYLAISIGAKTLPIALFSGFRFTLAGLILLAWRYWCGARLPNREEWKHLFVGGTLLIVFANGIVVWSSRWIPSGLTALLVTTAPFWMAFLESRIYGIRLSFQGILGILMGFVGLILLLAPNIQQPQIAPQFFIGALALQFGSFCWCSGSLYCKNKLPQLDPLVTAAGQMLSGGFIMGVIGLVTGELPRFHFNNESLLAFLYLVFFGAILGYGCYIFALSKLPAAKVSTYAYINPIVAIVLGSFWLGEKITFSTIISMLVIFSGVALVKSASVQPRSIPSTSAATDPVSATTTS
jgi:drug/metabolite transporter (DMT)-like permease